jgi:hypothetical protein
MTIGIIAFGPRAGVAVFKALRAVERVGRGSIGGYASFVAVTADAVLRYETQRGGTLTLFTAGETTGVEPDAALEAARLACVMSSGPDRPEPLAQFTPAAAGVGLMTGHRLPNMPGADGVPLNTKVLELMCAGVEPGEAVDRVLDANPNADAGLIAGSLDGVVYARNSARVQSRPDLGQARRVAGKAVVEVLHNAIHPVAPLADLAAEIALDIMLRRDDPDAEMIVRTGTPVVAGPDDRVLVNANLEAVEIHTSDARLASGRWNCAAIYLGARVVRDGRILGTTLIEPNMIVENGKLVSMSGQHEVRIGMRKREASV